MLSDLAIRAFYWRQR